MFPLLFTLVSICFSFVRTYFILFAKIFTILAILSCIVLDVSFKDIIMNFDFWWSLSPYHLVKDCNPVLFIRKINILFLLCFSMISAFLCFLAVSLFSIFHYCDYELSFFPYDSNFQNMGFFPPTRCVLHSLHNTTSYFSKTHVGGGGYWSLKNQHFFQICFSPQKQVECILFLDSPFSLGNCHRSQRGQAGGLGASSASGIWGSGKGARAMGHPGRSPHSYLAFLIFWQGHSTTCQT